MKRRGRNHLNISGHKSRCRCTDGSPEILEFSVLLLSTGLFFKFSGCGKSIRIFKLRFKYRSGI